jgi:predicted phosphodiesterase
VNNNFSKTAFISDVHGNSPALQAVLADIQSQRCTELIMLGDLIPGVDPHGCVEILRDWSKKQQVPLTCIRGNAEAYLLTPDRDELLVYENEWNQNVLNLVQWYQDHLTEEDLHWLRTFPDTLRWQEALLVHDSPIDRLAVHAEADPRIKPEHHEWFFHGAGIVHDLPVQGWDQLFQYMETEGLSRIYCGHTHEPFIRESDGHIICNVGSVGAPLDADWRPAWVLLDTGLDREGSLSIHRVEYDLSHIYELFDDNPDYPSFLERPGMMEAFKKWYATGLFWKVHIPGILPPEKDRAG